MMQRTSKTDRMIFAMFVALFVSLQVLPILVGYRSYCFNAADLGIYAQAIRLISWDSLNPFLPTRDVRIFFDHFDPIIIALAPLARVFDPSMVIILFESLSVLGGAFALLYLRKKQRVERSVFILSLAVYLFGYATFRALHHPGHPTNAMLFPMMWCGAFIVTAQWNRAFWLFVFCFLYREEFSAYGILVGGLGIYFSSKYREFRKPAIGLFLISFVWFIAVFALRPRFADQYVGYEQTFLSTLFDFRKFLASYSSVADVRGILMFFLPLIPMLFIIRVRNAPGVVFALLAICFFTARLLGGWWFPHRGLTVLVWLIFLVISSSRNPSPMIFRVSVLFSLTCMIPTIQQFSRTMGRGSYSKFCPSETSRTQALSNAIQSIPAESHLIAQSNLLPNLLKNFPNATFWYAGFERTHQINHAVFLLEKKPNGNSWPLEENRFQEEFTKIQQCQNGSTLFENEFVLARNCASNH